jgi:hypothetical protein
MGAARIETAAGIRAEDHGPERCDKALIETNPNKEHARQQSDPADSQFPALDGGGLLLPFLRHDGLVDKL